MSVCNYYLLIPRRDQILLLDQNNPLSCVAGPQSDNKDKTMTTTLCLIVHRTMAMTYHYEYQMY